MQYIILKKLNDLMAAIQNTFEAADLYYQTAWLPIT